MHEDLIIFNMSHRFDWEAGIVNRNWHVVQGLIASGRFQRILSIDFLPIDFRKLVKITLRSALWKKQPTTVWHSLTARVDQDLEKKNVFHLTALSLRDLPKILKQLAIDPNTATVWSYNPLVANIITQWPGATLIFDAVDNWLTHQSYRQYQTQLRQGYDLIAQHAAVIFTVADNVKTLFPHHPHVICIPNGVDAAHIASGACQLTELHHPVIGYHGIIESRVDIELVQAIVRQRPNYTFLLAGPIWKEVRAAFEPVLASPNVRWLGRVSYDALPNVLACYDVGIIPHRLTPFTQSMNPLKLYEYLAAGKPVICTPIAGVAVFSEFVQLATSADEFVVAIDTALAQDTAELQTQRQAAVASHTWSARVEQMLQIIDQRPS